MHLRPLAALAAASLTGVVLLAGCGSASKPAYCTQVGNFKDAVKTLEQVEVSPTNLIAIAADIQKVGTTAKELGTAVGTEFAPQISAIKAAAASLGTTIKDVARAPSGTSLAHVVNVVPTEIDALKHAVGEIQEVTKSKCD
jgi:hypothetical protein